MQLLDLDLGNPFDGTPFFTDNIVEHPAERPTNTSLRQDCRNLPKDLVIRSEPDELTQTSLGSGTVLDLVPSPYDDFRPICVNVDGPSFNFLQEVETQKHQEKHQAEKQIPELHGHNLDDPNQSTIVSIDNDVTPSVGQCSESILESSDKISGALPPIKNSISGENEGGESDRISMAQSSRATPSGLAISGILPSGSTLVSEREHQTSTRETVPGACQNHRHQGQMSKTRPMIHTDSAQKDSIPQDTPVPREDTENSWSYTADEENQKKPQTNEEILLDNPYRQVNSSTDMPLAIRLPDVSLAPDDNSAFVTLNNESLQFSQSESALGHKLNPFDSQPSFQENSTPELIVHSSLGDETIVAFQSNSKSSGPPPLKGLPLSSINSPLIPIETDVTRRTQQSQDAISYISSLGVRIGNNVYLDRDGSTISSPETSPDMQDVQTLRTISSSSTPTVATSITTSPTRSISGSLDSRQRQRSSSNHDESTNLNSKAVIDKSLAAIHDLYSSEAKPRTRTASRLQHMASFPRLSKGNERASVGKAIADAASEGNAARLDELVRDNPKLVDTRTSHEEDRPKTALMRAAIAGHINCMEVLKKSGANVSTADESSRTALHLAVAAHQTSSVRWLIGPHSEAGPIVTRNGVIDLKEMSDVQGSRPLHIAAKCNRRDIADILIAAGVSLEAVDNMGRTPLHCAAMRGHLDMCILLLSKVAYANALDANQMTPLHWAVKSNHVKIVDRLLAEGADPIIYDRFGQLPMHYAAEGGQLEVLEQLYTEQHDLERRTKLGETPLHLACSKNHLSVVKALLQRGVEVNPWTTTLSPKPPSRNVFSKSLWKETTDSSHVPPSTPLHYACSAGHYDCTEQLLKFGAWINAPQEDGRTPLMLSVESGNHQLVSLLLESGAQPNAATSGLCLTALHISCRKADLESTKLLVQHGSNVRARTSGVSAVTPSEYLQRASEKEVSFDQKIAVLDYLRTQTDQHFWYRPASAPTSPPSSLPTSETSQMPPPESMGISLGPSVSLRGSSPAGRFRLI